MGLNKPVCELLYTLSYGLLYTVRVEIGFSKLFRSVSLSVVVLVIVVVEIVAKSKR